MMQFRVGGSDVSNVILLHVLLMLLPLCLTEIMKCIPTAVVGIAIAATADMADGAVAATNVACDAKGFMG